jgi:hypothetical protein
MGGTASRTAHARVGVADTEALTSSVGGVALQIDAVLPPYG